MYVLGLGCLLPLILSSGCNCSGPARNRQAGQRTVCNPTAEWHLLCLLLATRHLSWQQSLTSSRGFVKGVTALASSHCYVLLTLLDLAPLVNSVIFSGCRGNHYPCLSLYFCSFLQKSEIETPKCSADSCLCFMLWYKCRDFPLLLVNYLDFIFLLT